MHNKSLVLTYETSNIHCHHINVITSTLSHLCNVLRVNTGKYFTFLTVPYLLSPQIPHKIAAGWNRNSLPYLFPYWDFLVAF